MVTSIVPSSGSAFPCVSSLAQPRETGVEQRNSAREWPWGTSLSRRPDPSRGSQDSRFPPSMSFPSGSLGDARGAGTSGLDSECSRNPRDPTDDMSTERIAERTVEIVRDLSTMLGGKRVPEVDNLVKSISSEMTSLAHKREFFRELLGKYYTIIDEFRAHQTTADQRAMDTLRQVAREFIAGNPLPTDGQLSFEPPYTGSSSVGFPQGSATAGSAQPTAR